MLRIGKIWFTLLCAVATPLLTVAFLVLLQYCGINSFLIFGYFWQFVGKFGFLIIAIDLLFLLLCFKGPKGKQFFKMWFYSVITSVIGMIIQGAVYMVISFILALTYFQQ